MKTRLCFIAAFTLMLPAWAGAGSDGIRWLLFPDEARFEMLGLPWFQENKPQLWRVPAKQMSALPKGVQGRSKCPSGARIVFRSDTTRLAVKAVTPGGEPARRMEVYVDGKPVKQAPSSAPAGGAGTVAFEKLSSQEKEIVIYLPHLQQVSAAAVGVDSGAAVRAAAPRFAKPLPVVFYGSSVCQGSGAASPAQTYPAILCRKLGLDFVNLGFGGAGKAEPAVVDLVKSVPACCTVFDLGKSYGSQDEKAFKAMLKAVREKHPSMPMIVVTPITSAREVKDAAYSARSVHTREAMRGPAQEMIKGGDRLVYLVEGEDLLGFKDHATLSRDGVHPTDAGYALIASRLEPVLRKALQLPESR